MTDVHNILKAIKKISNLNNKDIQRRFPVFISKQIVAN